MTVRTRFRRLCSDIPGITGCSFRYVESWSQFKCDYSGLYVEESMDTLLEETEWDVPKLPQKFDAIISNLDYTQ